MKAEAAKVSVETPSGTLTHRTRKGMPGDTIHIITITSEKPSGLPYRHSVEVYERVKESSWRKQLERAAEELLVSAEEIEEVIKRGIK